MKVIISDMMCSRMPNLKVSFTHLLAPRALVPQERWRSPWPLYILHVKVVSVQTYEELTFQKFSHESQATKGSTAGGRVCPQHFL
jgi:hypothetical protein